MYNITYFIGAGASYHCLPLIKTMNSRMQVYRDFLTLLKNQNRLTNKFADQYIEELNELIEIEPKRTQIDAYARELSISNDPISKIKLLRLKAILSGYILFEQLRKPKDLVFFSKEDDKPGQSSEKRPWKKEIQEMVHTHIDKRYITFWGNYLDESQQFLPPNIKIISWNYDSQFESSYSDIKKFNIEQTQRNLQVYPIGQSTIDLSRSCILKLNGTAGIYNDIGSKEYSNLFDVQSQDLYKSLDLLIQVLESNYEQANNKPLFHFAWENEDAVVYTRSYASKILETTDVLVIIGYSFPDFNRTVDKAIFKNTKRIHRVYYQAPIEEINELVDKLDGVNPDLKLHASTTHITNLATFHIPNEYWM